MAGRGAESQRAAEPRLASACAAVASLAVKASWAEKARWEWWIVRWKRSGEGIEEQEGG